MRRHSKKPKRSQNRKKSALRLARLHRKIRNLRQDFSHKLATGRAKPKRVVVVEELQVSGLLKHRRLAQPIADVVWGECRRMLESKRQWYGNRLVVANRYDPSKTCSCCGQVLEMLPLDVREWEYPACGAHPDRDGSGARNLLSVAG